MDETTWPLFGLRLRTPRLELRPPTDGDLAGLVAAMQLGIVGDEPYPFSTAWYDEPEPKRTREALAFHWRCRAGVTADDFNVPMVAVLGDTVIGVQSIGARDFLTLRTFGTGSWLAKPWQGQGLGKEMRTALLTFGFECLDGQVATSGARQTTDRSIKVSTSLGYRENGRNPTTFGGEVGEEVRFRLDRADWDALPDRPPVEITGWRACAPMFEKPAVEPS